MHSNFSFINNGYSSLWLLILYIIGAYIGRFSIIKNNNYFNLIYIFIYFASSFITSGFIILVFDKYKISNYLFLGYYSPTIIIQALSLIFFLFALEIISLFCLIYSLFILF